jgi:hypothetical protein
LDENTCNGNNLDRKIVVTIILTWTIQFSADILLATLSNFTSTSAKNSHPMCLLMTYNSCVNGKSNSSTASSRSLDLL